MADAFTLLDDQPFDEVDDPLGFDQIAASIANLIVAAGRSKPLTVGIEGGWGEGKSTLMKGLSRHLKSDRVATVVFNAWTAPEGEAAEGLVKSVFEAIGPSALRRAGRSQRFLTWSRALSSAAATAFGFGGVVDTLWSRLSTDPTARNKLSDFVLASTKLWRRRRVRRGETDLLVVFVDYLDRCPAPNVLQVFEAIKLYLNVEGIVFVIGYDRDVVTDAILGLKQYTSDEKSHDYVEKIVQLVYPLPIISDEAASRMLNLYLRAPGTIELFDEPTRALTVEQNARNPRRIKRFINGFILSSASMPSGKTSVPSS